MSDLNQSIELMNAYCKDVYLADNNKTYLNNCVEINDNENIYTIFNQYFGFSMCFQFIICTYLFIMTAWCLKLLVMGLSIKKIQFTCLKLIFYFYIYFVLLGWTIYKIICFNLNNNKSNIEQQKEEMKKFSTWTSLVLVVVIFKVNIDFKQLINDKKIEYLNQQIESFYNQLTDDVKRINQTKLRMNKYVSKLDYFSHQLNQDNIDFVKLKEDYIEQHELFFVLYSEHYNIKAKIFAENCSEFVFRTRHVVKNEEIKKKLLLISSMYETISTGHRMINEKYLQIDQYDQNVFSQIAKKSECHFRN